MSFARAAIVCAACLTSIGGCSAFTVADVYRLPTGVESAKVPVDDGELTIELRPEGRFVALGPLGAPVVPVYAKTPSSPELTVSVILILRADHAFAFPQRLCARNDAGSALCSDWTLIAAQAMYRESDGRMQNVRQFLASGKPWYNTFGPPDSVRVIDNRAVYRHYEYAGVPQWEFLKLSLSYHLPCSGACPQTLAVTPGDLLPETATAMELVFHRVRERDYEPMADLGP